MKPSQITTRPWAAIVATVVVFAVAGVSCGGVRTYPSVASGAAQQSPSPTPSAAPGYLAYVSPKWMYSLEYPATWYLLEDQGQDRSKWFSNQNIASPEQLDANGIWLTIDVNSQPSQPCSAGSSFSTPTVTQVQVSIDGVSGTEYLSTRGIEGPYVMHGNWCYHFSVLTTSAKDRDQHMPEIDHILSSFRFNR
jgi:hypothetical protein